MNEIDSLARHVLELTGQIAAIPAPSMKEHDRAALVSEWWSEFATPFTDEIGNVWAQIRDGEGPAIVVAAHLDTVFGCEVQHGVVERDGLLWGPSVGDDSVAVASLGCLDSLLPTELGAPVWLIGTVGEEGEGNLAGIRHAIANPPAEIGALIAIEGNWLGRVCLVGVGSLRYRVTLSSPGGHAWEAADVDSAVHAAARVIARLDTDERAIAGRTAINVGRFVGGQAINIRAPEATFDVDLRADSADGLGALEADFRRALEVGKGDTTVTVEPIGDRPAGSLDAGHPLALAAIEALAQEGITAAITAASTDANAAHAAQIPAIAVGITHGSGEHTLDEWIDPRFVATGLISLNNTIVDYVRRTR